MLSAEARLTRIRHGHAPRVLDLFAGCGGISLGFHAAGFALTAAVEWDPLAIASHAANFFPDSGSIHAKPHDITAFEPLELLAEIAPDSVDLGIDVIVGGPPCQAFARVGRAKLREVEAHPEAFRQDPRSNLYLRYIHYVRALRPLAILIENVPDVLNYAGHNIFEETCEVFAEMGYSCAYTLLNAAYFGVPQMRERAFLIAYASELGADPVFPEPTHYIDLPKGYEGSRKVALRPLQSTLFRQESFYRPRPEPDPGLPTAVTAMEALQDLPRLTAHLEGRASRGARRFVDLLPYRDDVAPSQYGVLMRSWPDFESPVGVKDHVIRSLPRDYSIFHGMKPGDQYPEAHSYALTLLEARLRKVAPPITANTYERLRKEIVPPYDPGKFPNKWRKMEADKPARTLMAHLGKDSYSHIHYDSEQARTISVREAARLQSFPDGFFFAGTMNPAFRQIGNAVPPLLAYPLAVAIRSALDAHQAPTPLTERFHASV